MEGRPFMFNKPANLLILVILLLFWIPGIIFFAEKARENETHPIVIIVVAVWSLSLMLYCTYYKEIHAWFRKRSGGR